jgi:CheY-like chemotaxis protein
MARSDAGSGSKFFFSLGLPVTEMAEMPHRMALFSKGEKVVRQLAKGYQVTALVVDDIRENRDVLTEMLEVVGCRVLTAEDAPSALESIGKTRPDIVFMDMRLPGMSGLEAVQEIIKRFGAETMRIVSMSASVMEHEQEAYLKAGCDDFVAKPVHTGRLYQCLETLLDVKFDYEETETSSESGNQKPVNLAQVAIPEDLALRMMMAAELHSTTVLKNCLSELRERGVAEARLAEHLKGFMASYDMDTIQKLLTQVPVLPTSAPPSTG